MSGASLEFLRRSANQPFATGELRMITLPAPAMAPERLLAAERRGGGPGSIFHILGPQAVFWAGHDDGLTIAGLGAAHVITASGTDRFGDVRREAERLWDRIRTVSHPDTAAPPPRVFGGFAFEPGRTDGPWNAFGDAAFVLPRLLYRAAPDGPTLSVTITEADTGGAGIDDLVASIREAMEASERAATDHGGAALLDVPGGMDRRVWREAVGAIRDGIREGGAEKVVAARRIALQLDRAPEIAAILRRLGDDDAEVRFAFRHGDATLVGATPERLISRRGQQILTEALAGSIDTSEANGEADVAGDRLLGSAKDTAEHAFVVDAIAGALAPLCERLDYPTTPGIKRLRHVLHLRTPFEGELAAGAEPVHVLDLVERLHPTPAVGGTPTGVALRWIDRHEPADRGWYAAPIGWFDADGDGDFVVALRSGLLQADRAYLYAGAGIVRDSDPDTEFAETETKLRTMMDALGIAP